MGKIYVCMTETAMCETEETSENVMERFEYIYLYIL